MTTEPVLSSFAPVASAVDVVSPYPRVNMCANLSYTEVAFRLD